jgi:transposase-like protein
MANGGKRTARINAMRGVLKRWERSGVPLSRFAEREGLAQKTLYRWRRRLGVGGDQLRRGRRAGASVSRERAAAQSSSMFTEVSSALRAASSAVTFEVVLRSGTMVRVPEHFDPGSLRILLQTLREC